MSPSRSLIHISTYAKRLMIRHIGYAIALVFFVILLVSFIPLQIHQYLDTRTQLKTAREDITKLDNRRAVIVQYPTERLDDLTITLNTLYPSVEDRFSIFTALENLQGVTGVGIVNYSSPFAGKTLDEISIGVKAKGDITAFRKLLRLHVFRSGRFMTLDKVTFDAKNDTINFTAKFYSKNVEIGSQIATQYSPDAIARLEVIQREVESSGLVRKGAGEDTVVPTNYSTKENPFE